MNLPTAVIDAITTWWQHRKGSTLAIEHVHSLSGGCINNVCVISHDRGRFCLKYNEAAYADDMFQKELKGLTVLVETDTIRVPHVFDSLCYDKGACLLMEYLPPAPKEDDFWPRFGQQLADLHRETDSRFGLDHNNFMGRLPQSNTRHHSFEDFFWYERLEPQLKLARDSGELSSRQLKLFDGLQTRITEICPEEPPALIHGDLWSGNFITGPDGHAALIDPAIAYSHRECDLAMTRLFGGFAPEFYAAYQEAFPLEPGFDTRVDFYNLYPLLVHVNLFGGGYVGQTMGVVRQFV